MQIPFIDSAAVAAQLDYPALIDALDQAHRQVMPAVGRALIEQPDEGGVCDAFLVLPAWQRGAALGVKVVTSFPGNAGAGSGLPAVQGIYLLFDSADGRPRALIDGTELTLRKTAADSALGARYLARADVHVLLMVGAGALARPLIAAHRAVRPTLRRVLVWNRTGAKAHAVAAELAAEGVDAAAIDDLEAGVRGADLITCATGATAPLVLGAWLAPGTHLDLVGGFTPGMREADDEAMRRAAVFVDSRPYTLPHCGDLVQPLAAGIISAADIRGDLFELAQGNSPGRQSADQITLFKNGGGAHLDLMTARCLAERLGL